MTIPELAAKLREHAAALESTHEESMLTTGKLTIAEGAAALRAMLGKDAYFAIRFEIDCHSNSLPKCEWDVYDATAGRNSPPFKGATLDQAIAAVQAWHSPKEEKDPVPEIDAMFAPVAMPDAEPVPAL